MKPSNRGSSFVIVSEFLEKLSSKLHDAYPVSNVLVTECSLIQSEFYKNISFLGTRNNSVLYYNYSNYYFEIESEDGSMKYRKSKEHPHIFSQICTLPEDPS